MTTALVSSKGRITIPAEIRHELNIKAGDRVKFTKNANGCYEFSAVFNDVSELKGMFGKPSGRVSITDMHNAIGNRLATSENSTNN